MGLIRDLLGIQNEQEKRQSALAQMEMMLKQAQISKLQEGDPLTETIKRLQAEKLQAEIQGIGQKQITPLSEIGKLLQDKANFGLSPDMASAFDEEISRKTNPSEQKNREEQRALVLQKGQAAQEFLRDIAPQLQQGLQIATGTAFNPETGALEKLGGNALGTIQGSELFRNTVGAVAPEWTGEDKRQGLDRILKQAELTVAQQYMKGQGAVTEAERAIARGTLPQLNDASPEVSWQKFQQILDQANNAVAAAEKLRGGQYPTKEWSQDSANTADGIQLDIPAPGKLRGRQQAEQPKLTPELALQELKRRQAMRGQQ